jgi:hypothetical protein
VIVNIIRQATNVNDVKTFTMTDRGRVPHNVMPMNALVRHRFLFVVAARSRSKDQCDDVPPCSNTLLANWSEADLPGERLILVCNCNKHSTKCRFNLELYKLSGHKSGGVCLDCQHNTAGRSCHYCREGFTRDLTQPMTSAQACRGSRRRWNGTFLVLVVVIVVHLHINSHCDSLSLSLSLARAPVRISPPSDRLLVVTKILYILQRAPVTIILVNVASIRNYTSSRVENQVESAFNANIIPPVGIVVTARKPFIAIQLCQLLILTFVKVNECMQQQQQRQRKVNG